jgi:hypothetical protein
MFPFVILVLEAGLIANLIAWIVLVAVAGFLYGRRLFARRFAAVSIDRYARNTFPQFGERARRRMVTYRLGLSLGFALIGAIVGFLIFIAGWSLTRCSETGSS